MVNDSSKEISNILNISKAFAILSVIIAHTDFGIENIMISSVLTRLGNIGVIVFLIISAYYFNPHKHKNLLLFLKSKITTILLPWLVLGSFVYLYTKLKMQNDINILDYINFIIGKGSYLYYLTIIISCYIIFFYIVKDKIRIILYLLIILNVISLLLTSSGIFENFIVSYGFTNYLNVFNWLGYFAIGIILKDIDLNHLLDTFKKYIILLLILCISLIIVGFYIESDNSSYFSKLGFLIQIIGSFIIFAAAKFEFFNNKVIRKVSEFSFSIYLLHFLIVPIVFKFLSFSPFISILMPFITLTLTTLLIYIGEVISKAVKLEKIYKIVLGIR